MKYLSETNILILIMESSEGNNTSTTTATVAQPLTPQSVDENQLRTLHEVTSEGIEVSLKDHN